MSVDRLSNVPVSISGPQAVGGDRAPLERLKADELAREFESMLLLQMLRQMRQSLTDETEEEKGLSADTMIDLVDSELARQLSRTGGFGLAQLMRQAIERQVPQSDNGRDLSESVTENAYSSVSYGQSVSRSQPTVEHHAALDGARLTSDFGWRSDPFTGALRYHQGVDFKAAYGERVPSAADGRVVDVGDRGAYGLSVVIEHPDGVRTRYAHLASLGVAAGDRVLQGQEIGRVGQSGRATGPHLHFEVIRDGKRVDPTTEVALQGPGLGGLKLTGGAADFPIGGHVQSPAMSGADDED